jgi:hypothetical protein
VTNAEQLIEAVNYASDNSVDWQDIFDSPADASKVVSAALKERPDENEMICLLIALDIDHAFEECTLRQTYLQTLRQLKRNLA